MTHPDPNQDLIDMIAKATPDTPVNEDHRDALRQQVLDAYDQRDAGTEPTRNPLFKITGATAMKIAASFTLLAAVGVFAITAFSPTKAIAFEQVAKEILDIENASFDLVSAVEYPDGQSTRIGANRVTIELPDKMRMEIAGGMVMITDIGKDQMLVLMKANKTATLVPGISSEFGALDEGQGRFLGNLQDHFRRAEQGGKLDGIKYEKLAQQQIDGKEVIGFRVLNIDAQNNNEPGNEPASEPMSTIDIWTDAETGTIIRLVYRMPAADKGTAIYTYKNFVYNQELDPGLLSLEAPEGYTLVDARQGALAKPIAAGEGANADADALRTMLEVVRTYAAIANDGMFPKTLSADEVTQGMIVKWQQRFPDKPVYKDEAKREFTDPQLAEVLGVMDNAFTFLRKLEADGVTYVYAGDGVKYGQSDRPILWFKPKGAQTYTVVYGDTRIKQADEPPVTP
jgi:outer membrane lipoprotein-sorting protein